MIESKILGSAVGIQRQDVIDNTESTVLPSLANGVIMGRFKRGRMDKPFKVTSANYRNLLGHDPSNPNYMAVEDAFKRGISEVSILRTGATGGGGGNTGGISCVASGGYILKTEGYTDSEWITFSRNGGPFKSYDFNSDDTDYDEFNALASYGQDGKSLAFIDYPYMFDGSNEGLISGPDMGWQPVVNNVILGELPPSPRYYWSFFGISSDGSTLIDGNSMDLKTIPLRYPETRNSSPKNEPRAEHNWLVFKPTPNVDPDSDLFYRMDATGDTLEVHSCAVMEPFVDPNVCTPTYNDTLFNIRSGDTNPLGPVHAKYRINGGPWETYTDPNNSNDYSVVNTFFESIYYDDWQMIHVGGGNGESAFATGYHQANIYGASATSQYMKDQDGIRAYKAHTIEFAVTENSRNDLVYLAFGKDVTIKSCAIGTWMGY